MTKLIVVVDDERTFDTDEPIIYLRTNTEAISWLAQWWMTNETRPMHATARSIDQLWFDHDLGDGGEAIVTARFLSCLNRTGHLPIGIINVHSQNPVGADNLLRELAGCAGQITRQPLPNLKDV